MRKPGFCSSALDSILRWLRFNEWGVVQLPFVLQEQIALVSSLFKRYENVPASLADAA
jgi:hypothetical protein